MIKEIAIYGAGGLGRELACMIEKLNRKSKEWEIIGFFDDGIPKGTNIFKNTKVIGDNNDLQNWDYPLNIGMGIGSPKIVQRIVSSLTNELITFPNLISPDFEVEDVEQFSIGKGNIIKSSCRVTTNVHIGNFNVFNGSITIGHDTIINDFNIFMPGVRISGEVAIGNRNLFGSMSFVKQCLKIGDDIILSPLSPLLSKPKNGLTYMGNPAKPFKF